jgi:hypothetical protein
MEGTAMAELKLHGLSWRGREWEEEGEKGRGSGGAMGAVGEGSVRPALFGPGLRAVREKKTARRKEKRRERKEKKKGRKKENEEKGKNFEIWKFLERKINDNL